MRLIVIMTIAILGAWMFYYATRPDSRVQSAANAPIINSIPKARGTTQQKHSSQPVSSAEEVSSPRILSGTEQASLERSLHLEEDWKKKRSQFLSVDLKVSDTLVEKLNLFRESALRSETELMASLTDSDEAEENLRRKIKQNRESYLEEVENLIGAHSFKQFRALFSEFWKSNPASPHSSFL